MSQMQHNRNNGADDEQSVTSRTSRRRESNIQDIRTRWNAVKKYGQSLQSKPENLTVVTGEPCDEEILPNTVTPTYRRSEEILQRSVGSEKGIEKEKRLLRTSSRTPESHFSQTSGIVSSSGIKSSGMKGGARRVARNVPMSPAIKTSSKSPGLKARALAITPSPREMSGFTFQNNSYVKAPNSTLRIQPECQSCETNETASAVKISTDAAILNTLSSLSLNDDKRKRLASGPKRIPRQRSSAKKHSLSTPPNRLLRSTAATRSKVFNSTSSRSMANTDSVGKLVEIEDNTTKFCAKHDSEIVSSTKISLMDDFSGEIVDTSKIPNNDNREGEDNVLSASPDAMADPRVERIRTKLKRPNLETEVQDNLLDGYLKNESDQSCDLVDSFDEGATETINTVPIVDASSTTLKIIDRCPKHERSSSDENESFDSVSEHFRIQKKSEGELAFRISKSYESSGGRINPVAKTLSEMDPSDTSLFGEERSTFSGGGKSSAFSGL